MRIRSFLVCFISSLCLFLIGGSETVVKAQQPNSPPTANNDTYRIQRLGIVLQNDSDPDGDSIGAQLVTQATHGTITLQSHGVFYYNRSTFTTEDSFTYKACDSKGACSTPATVRITNVAPIANDDTFRIQALGMVRQNDSDPDGDSIAPVLVTQTSHGEVTFFPNGAIQYRRTDFTTEDSFTYKICDSYNACSSPATVRITNVAPVANDDTYRIDRLGIVLQNDTDADGDPLGSQIVTVTSHGTVGMYSHGVFTYTRSTFTTEDSFTYKACDSYGACSTATVRIINQRPVANSDVFSVINGKIIGSSNYQWILGNDYDPDEHSIYAHLISPTTNGRLNVDSYGYGAFSYIPNPGFNGTDTFTYKACDSYGGCSDPTTVTLFVFSGSDEGAGNYCTYQKSVGQPINTANGNMWLEQTDYNLTGVGESINISRFHNSVLQNYGLFGRGWSTQYDERITVYDNKMLRLNMPDGRAIFLGRTDTAAPFSALTPDFYGQVVKNSDGSLTLTFKDGRVHQFNNAGTLLWLKDRQGNQTTLNYDAFGKLTGITDTFGRTLNITLNANGFVEQLSDSLGVVAAYEYGTSGELKTVTYPDGSKYKFTYITRSISGVNHLLLTEVKDALDNILEKHEYDGSGKATTSEKHGGVEKYTLVYYSNYTQVTDALGRITKYYYNKINGRAAVTKIEGNCNCGSGSQVETYEYDSQLNLTKKTDALNNVTTYTYDSNGNQLTETTVLGTETYTYNSLRQVLTRKDRMNGVTINTYDAQGNLLTTKDALNKTTTFTYTTKGQLKTVQDARSNTTTLTYDAAGRLTEVKDADNKNTIYGYDARARVTSVKNGLNQTTAYEYDSRDRLKKVTYPDAKFVTYNYDLAGRRTSMVDARNNTTVYGYDNAYRLTSVTDPLNHTTTFGYDLMSNRTSVTDALNNTTNYEFDNFDRLKKIVYPPATAGATRLEEQIEYDAVGNVKKRVDTANRETVYDYDTAHRLTQITDADLKPTGFEYNNRSQMTAVVDALSQRYEFTYDPLGRVLTQTRAGFTMSFEYDAAGNRSKRTDYKGVVTTYVYDALNRLQTIVYPNTVENVGLTYDAISQLKTAANQNGTITFNYDNRSRVNSTTDVWNKTIAYGYDANSNRNLLKLDNVNYATYAYDLANRLTRITASDDSKQVNYGYDNANKLTSRTFPNGVSTVYEYDNMSRLKRLKDAKGATTLFDRQYGYNDASQISQIVEPAKTRTFGYDDLDRLTSVTPSVGANETYAFDAVGNRTASHLSANYTHQSFNRLTATAGATFGYDNNGNLTSRTETGGTWFYEWDYENRLKKATKPNGDYVIYKYDALGRRIERSLNSGAFTRFTYDGQDVLVDNDSALGTVKYLNGLGIDNKLRQKVGASGAQYFLADHLGSTNGLADASGALAAQAGYDAFGNQTGAALPTRYGYTGRERDDFTGLLHYRARSYSPELGRFISEDPIGFAGGDVNLYGYVKNQPCWLKDPSGLNPRYTACVANWSMAGAGIGFLGGGGAGMLTGPGGIVAVPAGAYYGAAAGGLLGAAVGASICGSPPPFPANPPLTGTPPFPKAKEDCDSKPRAVPFSIDKPWEPQPHPDRDGCAEELSDCTVWCSEAEANPNLTKKSRGWDFDSCMLGCVSKRCQKGTWLERLWKN